MKKILGLLLSTSLLYSCQKDINESLPAVNRQNVSYGADAAQTMDYYLPADRSSSTTKVIILVHGGGWSMGDKADFGSYIDTLKKRLPGYAIFNLNYRLAVSGTNLFPTQENDVKAALDFIYSKRQELKISEKWVMLGVSAGAHLSLLQSYKYNSPVKIKAVVDLFGPTDLVDMYNFPASVLAPPAMLSSVIGGTPLTHTSLYQQSSPINFITAQTPPTIILHGGLDPLVLPSQSLALKNRLHANAVVHTYVFYPLEAHGWIGANMVDSFDKIVAFLTANVP